MRRRVRPEPHGASAIVSVSPFYASWKQAGTLVVCDAAVPGVSRHDSATLSWNVEIKQEVFQDMLPKRVCWSSVIFASLTSSAALRGLNVHNTSTHLVCA